MLEGKAVYAALLLFADFTNNPARFWFGPGTLKTLDGNTRRGGGALISIDVLAPALGTTAQPASVKLSGVDQDIVRGIVEEMDDAVERDLRRTL